MPYDIVLIHNAQNASRYYHMQIKNEVSKILLKAVQESKFHPKSYALFEDGETGNHSYGSTVYLRINGKLEAYPPNDDYFNKSRKKIGLETRDELRKKVLFEERDKRFTFNNQIGIFTLRGSFYK